MTISRIIQSTRIGLEHIDCEPVWNKEDQIELFDIYLKDGTWIGSKRLLRHCEELDARIRR